jgi:DNA/RNA-binding domain of Phe-tRNA-synthetase-like protein
MKISIENEVLQWCPALTVSGIVVRGINLQALGGDGATDWPVPDALRAERVIKDWKALHKSVSTEKKARSSIEYLVKAASKGSLRSIGPLVDLYNHASLMTLAPFGGEDIACLEGGLTLARAQGHEAFVPLGKTEIQTPGSGEVLWLDGRGRVVCRALNWLESDLHKITEASRDVVFVSERPGAEFPDPADGLAWLAEKLAPCSRQIECFVLDTSRPVLHLEHADA